MDEQAAGDAEMPGSSGPADNDRPGSVPSPVHPALVGPEAEALAAEAEQIRRLVDAGAGSPEELRALAERLRAHRAREDALWRAQVKPTLKPKRGGLIGAGTPGRVVPDEPSSPRQSLALGLGLLGLVAAVVLLAASSTILWVLLPVVGVLAAAWWLGKQAR